MMRIPFIQIIKVIFVLSTIVTVTDCCSSRILLLREHTLKIVEHQHNFHNHMHEHAHELQQQIEEHVVQLVNQMELQQQHQQQQEEEQQQLPPTVREVPPEPDEDGELLPNTVEEASEKPMLEEQLLGEPPASSTEYWPTGESTTKTDATTDTTTTLTTVTHTGEPPPDDTSPSTTGATFSTTFPPDKVKDTTDIVMLPCSDSFKTNFCLNGGNCFRYPLGNNSLYWCRCADGYDGLRCEFKNWNGDYVKAPPALEAHPKIRMARIVFSFPMLILLSTIYVLFAAVFMLRNGPEYRRKQQQLSLHKQRFFVRC